MKDIHQKLLATFEVEHRDHVEQIRSLMMVIGGAGAGQARSELDEVFRRAHSLKGAARAVDLHSIEKLAHRLETLFSRVRQGTCELDQEMNRVVQQVLDASEDCIANLGKNQPAETAARALDAIESVLGVQKAEAGETAAETPAAVSAPAFQSVEMVRITSEHFDGLFETAGGLVRESQLQDEVSRDLQQEARDISALEKETERAQRTLEALRRRDSSHEVALLTSLVGSIQHQARTLSRRTGSTRRLHQRRSWSLRQLARQLQQDVWKARMVPAESLLDGYRKMMRDLARDEGKEIEFCAGSASVNVDRRVLDALKDPLMHLLRNAVSHGIESASERIRKGKKPAGLVTLRVDSNGQRLTVTAQDDGRGVDLARVAELAVQEGILSLPEATHSTAQDLTRILFRPGFSTSSAVTNLAGRGMGLSVVYESVRRLQGDIDVQPSESGGTIITLSVPLSIASHRLIVVNCGRNVFAIPVPGIERLMRIKRSSVETVEGRSVIVYGGQQILLTSIHALLGMEHTFEKANAPTLQAAILRSGGQRVAVAVDAVIREVDAVIQDLGYAAGCGGRIASGVVLDDGSIAFLVNPMELLTSAFQSQTHRQPTAFAQPPEAESAQASTSILVVDDSMTTRTLEKSILEAHGYQVRIAVDGVDALARLREERADLVIADIEMPRLNGFGLVEAMKKDVNLQRIPVIMVSSLERREDQERGLALGADAYIVKRKFDSEELLRVISQII